MDNIKELAKLVAHYIKGDEKKTKAYDTSATVKRIANGIAYVQIPGGVSETPVKLTIDAKKGDTVQVRVSNGTAWLVGNRTAPPTDDTTANIAKTKATTAEKVATVAEEEAGEAQVKANAAATQAAAAKQIADNTEQHFWFTETGADTGAHITEVTQEEWNDPTDPNYQSGGNLLARSNGMAVRDGVTELASFGAGTMQLGENGTSNILLTSDTMSVNNADGGTAFSIDASDTAKSNITTTILFDPRLDIYGKTVTISQIDSITTGAVFKLGLTCEYYGSYGTMSEFTKGTSRTETRAYQGYTFTFTYDGTNKVTGSTTAPSSDRTGVMIYGIIYTKEVYEPQVVVSGTPYLEMDGAYYFNIMSAGNESTKVLSNAPTGFDFRDNVFIYIHADSDNTANNVSLSIGGVSKAAYYKGSRVSSTNGSWVSGQYIYFWYDGTYWQEYDEATAPPNARLLYNLITLGMYSYVTQ